MTTRFITSNGPGQVDLESLRNFRWSRFPPGEFCRGRRSGAFWGSYPGHPNNVGTIWAMVIAEHAPAKYHVEYYCAFEWGEAQP